jgi:signal transduction histidine kinase
MWHGSLVLANVVVCALFAVLAYLGERTTLQVSGSIDQSLSTPVHIAAILLFPPPLPVLITLIGPLLAQARQVHKPLYKRAFNICHPTLTVGLSSALCSLVAVPATALEPGHVLEALPVVLLLLALYYIIDVGMLLTVLVLLQRRPPWEVWQHTYQPTLLPELAASAIGVLAAVIWQYDHILLALVVLPVIALRVAFRSIANAEAQAAALRRHADQLEIVLAAGQRMRVQQTEANILQAVVEAARAVVDARAVAGYLRDQHDPGILRQRALAPPDASEAGPAEMLLPPAGDGLPDADEESRTVLVSLVSEEAGVTGLLRLVAVSADVDGARDVLAILATQAGIALDNARLLASEQQARTEAEAAVHVRDDFLAAASHDLRTPLAAISGRIDLLRFNLKGSRALDRDWLGDQVSSAHRAIRRMTSTLEEITDATLLQMGQILALSQDVVDVGELVRATVHTVTEANKLAREVSVLVDAAPGLVVEGDHARLERVVQNIIGNAIKYSPLGTPVYVDVRREEQGVGIVVRDSGVGIPADELPRIFTRFYRASTAKGINGTGLGLAGAKMMVEQHGGHITLTSTVGQGTTVRVFLPTACVQEDATVVTTASHG